MLQEARSKLPTWVDDYDTKYDIVMSDDIDSFLGTVFLLHNFDNYRLNYFYSFDTLYEVEKSNNDKIYVDVDVVYNKGWGNHVTTNINKQIANLNVINNITQRNYYQKYAGSTLLTILSYYDYPIFIFGEEAQKVLLAVDCSFKGFYMPKFKEYNKKYINDVLEFDYLYQLQSKYSMNEFYNVIKKYNLHEKIYVGKDGYLQTKIKLDELSKIFGMDLSLPTFKFTPIKKFKNNRKPIKKLKKDEIQNMFSFALTRKEYCNFSIPYFNPNHCGLDKGI